MSRDNGVLIVECFFINLLKLMLLEYITGLQASAIDTFVNQILDLKKEILSRLQFHIV